MSTSSRNLGLDTLADCPLTPVQEAELLRCEARGRGSPIWRKRKPVELRELFQLSRIASRLSVERIDAVTDLRVMLRMQCAVPCMPEPDGDLVIEREAVLGITYPEVAIRSPQPGYAFVEILEPQHVFLSVVPPKPPLVLCLGTTLPVGLPLREIVLAAYGALTMQNVMIDERDPAGVMNAAAAVWWQQRPDLIPLSDVPFLAGDDLQPDVRP